MDFPSLEIRSYGVIIIRAYIIYCLLHHLVERSSFLLKSQISVTDRPKELPYLCHNHSFCPRIIT